MQQDIVVELEKRKRNLQYMVEDMLAQRRAEMLEVLMDKVHCEIKQEFEMYAQATKRCNGLLYGRHEVPALCSH